MAIVSGSLVLDPRLPDTRRQGVVLEVTRHPACLLRTVTVAWEDTGTVEDLLETEFGPLED
jgi:hypothetical protein